MHYLRCYSIILPIMSWCENLAATSLCTFLNYALKPGTYSRTDNFCHIYSLAQKLYTYIFLSTYTD